MRKQAFRWLITAAAAGGFLPSQVASATELSTWQWGGSSNPTTVSGVAVSGTADFSIIVDGSGYDLVIALTNTAAKNSPTSTAQILTGLYFDISTAPGALSMYSAVASLGMFTTGAAQSTPTAGTAGTNMCAPGAGESGVAPNATNCTVDGGWEAAYKSTGLGGGASATEHYGIGTSGQTGVFKGSNVNTFDYGLAPEAGINPANGGGLSNAYPPGYAAGAGTFTLTGLTAAQIVNIQILNVEAAYGTAPEGTPAATIEQQTSTPEPASGFMLAGAIAILGLFNRGRRLPSHLHIVDGQAR